MPKWHEAHERLTRYWWLEHSSGSNQHEPEMRWLFSVSGSPGQCTMETVCTPQHHYLHLLTFITLNYLFHRKFIMKTKWKSITFVCLLGCFISNKILVKNHTTDCAIIVSNKLFFKYLVDGKLNLLTIK